MYFFTLCKQILRDMWAWKMRSFLALCGITWGTITVILLLALGTGFTTASKKNMRGVTDGTFFAWPTRTSKPFHGLPIGRSIHFKADTIMSLKTNVPNVERVSPMMDTRTKIQYKNNYLTKSTIGAADDLAYLQKVFLIKGSRFLNSLDIQRKNYVAVLGSKIKAQLFKNEQALGKSFFLNGIKFKVIGVTQQSKRQPYDFYKNNVVIPYTTFIKLFGNKDVAPFIVFPNPNVESKSVQQAMRSYLGHKYHFASNDKTALVIYDTTKFFQFIRWFFIGVQIFLGICGSLTLGVGSLGVANIMFLIVSERTKEIGLRMAIGAKSWNILLHILLEALIIVGLGGCIGFFISYSVVAMLNFVSMPSWLGTPVISTTATTATIIILAILALSAGYFPARRAAKMDPVEALGK